MQQLGILQFKNGEFNDGICIIELPVVQEELCQSEERLSYVLRSSVGKSVIWKL